MTKDEEAAIVAAVNTPDETVYDAVLQVVETIIADRKKKAGREALMDAADFILPGELATSALLTYLAVTKYGRADFDYYLARGLIKTAS